ncbi:hypothetical protein ACKWTF_009030 [Chironomus riparius]
MDEITIKVDDLISKIPAPIKGCFRSGTLTLKLVPKKLCSYCKRERKNDYSCCGSYTSNIINLEVNASIEHNCDLKADMKKALFDENLSDFIFIVDMERIPVSKIILAARSPVFKRMFFTDFKEKNKNELIIKSPLLKLAFKELIRYIYTGEVCNISKYVFDLLHTADHYQVEGLKAICEEELQKILCANNAYKIFQSAHSYQCKSVLKSAAFLIIKNIFQSMNLIVPEEFVNNPSKVAKLFEKKESLEKELAITIPKSKK